MNKDVKNDLKNKVSLLLEYNCWKFYVLVTLFTVSIFFLWRNGPEMLLYEWLSLLNAAEFFQDETSDGWSNNFDMTILFITVEGTLFSAYKDRKERWGCVDLFKC